MLNRTLVRMLGFIRMLLGPRNRRITWALMDCFLVVSWAVALSIGNSREDTTQSLPTGYGYTPAWLNATEKSMVYVGNYTAADPPNTYAVNVLLAGDDEMVSRNWQLFGETLSWSDFAKQEIYYASVELNQRFGIVLRVVATTTYQSDDSLGISEALLADAVSKIGFYNSMIYDGVRVDMLIVFSDQSYAAYPLEGVSYENGNPYAASLVKPQTILDLTFNTPDFWPTSNLVQHEVSHLYGALDHIDSSDPNYYADCIMSYRNVTVTWLYKYGWNITINKEISETYATNNYCTICYNTIQSNSAKYGILLSYSFSVGCEGGGGGREPEPW